MTNGLKRLTSRETGFDLVPPLDPVGFAELPAEQNDASVTHARKVDKSASVVFELYAALMQVGRQFADLVESFYITCAIPHSSAGFGGGRGGFCGISKSAERRIQAADLFERRSCGRQHFVRF